MSNLWLVAKKEYTKVVRKPTFWIATFLFPAFMALVTFVSGYSAEQATKKLMEEAQSVTTILIVDETGLINTDLVIPPYVVEENRDRAIDQVKTNHAEAAFVYTQATLETGEILVYAQDTGLVSRTRFTPLATELARQSILLRLQDPVVIQRLNAGFSAQTTTFKDGIETSFQLEAFIVPVATVVIYFLLTFLSTNFLLASVSEEKESRMIEILMSIITSRDLIWGKIVGLTGIVLTQLGVLALAGYGIWQYATEQVAIPIDFSLVQVTPFQIGLSAFYLIAGFLIMAASMVGVGAIMPSYKEAQNFSSFFIIAAIFPIYFAALIVQEPSGLIAMVLSYFPLTAPLILLARHVLNALPVWEMWLSGAILAGYVFGALVLAQKLFEIGSLEYTNRLSFKRIFKS